MVVSIVIPNWNGRGKLEKNLAWVLEVEGVSEVIVVDDASSDESVEFIEKNFPKVRLVKRSKNGGFSSAVNSGVKVASGDFVFLLNTDAVPEKNCWKYILPHFEDPRVFSVGLSSGGSWNWAYFKDGYFWHKMATKSLDSNAKDGKAHQTLWVSGGSGVFRKKVWDALGGLDELFNPFYEEDLDLGYRATKRGYVNIFEPKAKVLHEKEKGVIAENFSKSKVSKIAQRNQLLFIWKNITDNKMSSAHKKALFKMILTHPTYIAVFLSAFSKLDEIKKRRRLERDQEILPDIEILSKFKINY